MDNRPGVHTGRGQNAHMVTLQSLLSLYSEECFKQNSSLYKSLADLAGEVNEACRAGDSDAIRSSWEKLLIKIENLVIYGKMKEHWKMWPCWYNAKSVLQKEVFLGVSSHGKIGRRS